MTIGLLLEQALLSNDDVQLIEEDILALEGLLVDIDQRFLLNGRGGTE